MRPLILLLAAASAIAAAESPAAAPAGEDLTLAAGRSLVIDYAADISRISTSNPDVADAVAVSNREVLINAKAVGTATVIIWSKAGLRTVYPISVEPNIEPVRQLLKKTFPDYEIQVQAARDSLSLTGTVPSQAVADRATALVAPLAKAVVNNLRVVSAGPDKQILLRVKFAELNRSAASALGVNLVSTGAGGTVGVVGTGQFGSVRPEELKSAIGAAAGGFETKLTISDALNIFAFRPDLNFGAFIKALQSRGLLQILAEPNLVATNGKDASFLVGGEFPVPIVQGGSNAGAVTIVFKEFGIRLTFQPNLTEHDTIRMHVKPEVSTIDLSNSVLYSGFTIPALATRRMETDIELGEGQSFVIAGLIDERVTESMTKLPGLSNIPILGALFKSRSGQKSSTELIVMVTPEITVPLARGAAKPLPSMPKEFMTPYMLEPGTLAPKAQGPAKPAAGRKGK